MKRKPQPVSVEKFPEEIRTFIELDRKVYNFLYEHKNNPGYEIAANEEFLKRAADAFTEEQTALPRDISFGEFIIESLETFTFK